MSNRKALRAVIRRVSSERQQRAEHVENRARETRLCKWRYLRIADTRTFAVQWGHTRGELGSLCQVQNTFVSNF